MGFCIVYGYFGFQQFQQVVAGSDADIDCFFDLGAYKVCNATQRLACNSSLALLMAQALASRVFQPGVSNFVNASVRRFASPARGGARLRLLRDAAM